MADPEKQLNRRHLKALSMQILRVNGKSILKKYIFFFIHSSRLIKEPVLVVAMNFSTKAIQTP